MSSIMRRRRGLISAIGNSCLMRWFTKPTLSDRRPRRQPLPTAKRFRSIRNRYSTVGVGLDWTLIPGPVSALIDNLADGSGTLNLSHQTRSRRGFARTDIGLNRPFTDCPIPASHRPENAVLGALHLIKLRSGEGTIFTTD